MGEHERLARPDRGQSESTGIILIVLIAFILGTSVAAFAFTTFQQEKGPRRTSSSGTSTRGAN